MSLPFPLFVWWLGGAICVYKCSRFGVQLIQLSLSVNTGRRDLSTHLTTRPDVRAEPLIEVIVETLSWQECLKMSIIADYALREANK